MLHVNQGLSGGTAHNLDGVLVTEEVAALDGIVGVVFPVVATVGKSGVDAALGGVGMAPHGMHFADDSGVGALCPGRDGRAHTGKAGANHKDIMLQHIALNPPGSS